MKRLSFLAFVAVAGCSARVATEPVYATNDPEPIHGRVQSSWVTIADRYSADSERQFIKLGGDTFRKIRIEAARGAPVIRQVAIEFADNGDTQAVRVDDRMTPGESRTIDLNGGVRPIRRIIVYTAPEGGAYNVLGV